MVMVRTSRRFAKYTSLSGVGLLALLLLPPVLRAQQTIHVPAGQPTIQSAINAANNGDTVLVAPGTYIENINFNGKAITVTSSGGHSVTIIDGGAKGSVVTFTTGETASSVLSGFTIRNGQSDPNSPGLGAGGGILVGSASPTISGNVITGNRAITGAGISVQNGSPTIQNNNITGNTQCCGSGGGGGGIHLSGNAPTPASPKVIGNTITNNIIASGGNGGGILVDYSVSPTIQNNLIQGNVTFNNGGGVALTISGFANLIQNVIANNSSTGGSGGGVFISAPGSSSFTIIGNTITGNTASDNTSGAYISALSAPFPFTNNIVVAAASQTAMTCDPANGALSPNFSHNDVYSGGLTHAGNCDFTTNPGNISSDPLFMSAANGDVHLKLGSPAIDVGDSTAPNLLATDFDGNPRTGLVNGVTTIDMGAYEVVNTSAASLNPNSLPFGSQAVGTTSLSQLTVLGSTGATPFQITSIQTTSDFSETNACPIIGAPGSAPGVPTGSSCGFNISFTPATDGPSAGLLTVNGTNGTSLLVSLTGTGFTPIPMVSLSPPSLTFSPQIVGTTSAPQPVTLMNTGNGSLSISSISASQPFSASTLLCGASLAAGANCTIYVVFQPVVSGNATGTLTIVDSAIGSPHTVSLSGTGNPVPQPVAITLVQHAGKDAGTTTSSSLAFPSNNAAGNWIAVAIRAGHSGQSFTVKDSNGNTYHQAIQFNVTTDAPNGDALGIFYAENIASGANQVTVSDTISGTMRIAILEYSGVASSSSLDAAIAGQGSSNAPLSGSITTSTNGDLLLGAVLTGNGAVFTAGSGYLIEERVPAEPGTKLIVEDQVQPASGTTSASVSLGAADNWGAAVLAFKPATTSVSTSPTITSLTPNSGATGVSVTITGTNFGATQGTSTVTFNGTLATPTSWSATAIVAPVPAGTTTGNVVVTVAGVASNGVSFAILPQSISSLNPTSGSPSTLVTISGSNFGSAQGTSTVTFNGITATPTSWNANTIVVLVPVGSQTGNVVVTVAGIASNGLQFTVTPITVSVIPTAPTISIGGSVGFSAFVQNEVQNNNAKAGVSWVLSGAGCSGTTCGTLTIIPSLSYRATYSAPATLPNPSTVTLTATSNADPTKTAVTIITLVQTPAPSITNLNPASGPLGTSLTITGTNFGASQGSSSVLIGGGVPTVTSWSDTSIVAIVPNLTCLANADVIVAVNGLTSNSANFSITPSPNITNLSAFTGSVGDLVIISGTTFGASQGTSRVTFNGISAGTASSWSATSIGVVVPNGATTGPVVVTVSCIASDGPFFAVVPRPAPSITNLSPNAGVFGTSITIAGTNFAALQGTSTVTFNGTTATPTSWSSTNITAPVPTGATTGNVVVVVGGVASNGVSFSVTSLTPTITSLNPSNGPAGTSVTITGTNFGATQGNSTVTLNGASATPTSWSATSIVASLPIGATTGPAVVTVGGFSSNRATFAVTPNVSGLNPSSGPIFTSVTVSGSNFGASQGASTVTFGGIGVAPSSWSDTSFLITAPNLSAGPADVQVTVGGFGSNAVAFQVRPAITSLNPTSGPMATSVTITGSSFGVTQGTSTVTFNGTAATPMSWGDNSITVPVPSGATSGNVVVTVGGVASNGVPFTVNSAAPSIALVQHISKDAGTTSSSSLAFSANNTAGNFIAVVIRAGKSGQVFSVSDSRGNVYKQAIHFNVTVDAETLGIFYAENIVGGANTITVSDTILGTMRFAILEYSGVATSNSLDVSVAAEGTGVSPGTGSITTASSGDLLLGEIVTANPATFTAGSGYTIEERAPAEPNTKLIVEDQRQSIAGIASAGASLGVSDQWGAVLVAFRHP